MLERIGFYTMEDARVKGFSNTSPMWRCELEITSRCNFRCPYCRGLQHKGDIDLLFTLKLINQWKAKNIRFSGGEPTLHPDLDVMVKTAHQYGRVAVSTNGSQSWDLYRKLISCGVTDYSVSLDACCSSTCDTMSGITGAYPTIIENIRKMSEKVYTTVGIVINDDNVDAVRNTILMAHGLGVADIRPIPAAQYGKTLGKMDLPQDILDAHPILKYRVMESAAGEPVRGLRPTDSHYCWLTKDDSCVAGNVHYPCVIYMREQGQPIGAVNSNMREDRIKWCESHDTHTDPICSGNCLDVCREFNNAVEAKNK